MKTNFRTVIGQELRDVPSYPNCNPVSLSQDTQPRLQLASASKFQEILNFVCTVPIFSAWNHPTKIASRITSSPIVGFTFLGPVRADFSMINYETGEIKPIAKQPSI